MAKKKTKTKAGLKWKRKKWFVIEAPKNFQGKSLGEAMAEAPSNLIGRKLTANVMQLTGNFKKQNLFLKLKIIDVQGNTAKTEICSFAMQASSVRHIVRKGTSKIDDSFCCMTKDGKKIRIKPLAVTRAKVKSGVKKKIFHCMAELVIKKVKETNYENLIMDIINFDFQKGIKKTLDKIYPLKSFQIKFAGLETKTRAKTRDAKEEIESGISETEELPIEDEIEEVKENQVNKENISAKA